MKILISLFLFLPCFAFSFIVGVSHTQTPVCEKLDSDYTKASAYFLKTLTRSPEAYDDISKAHVNLSKILSDGLKHKCFKQVPECTKSVEALSKTDIDSAKVMDDLFKVVKANADSPKKMIAALDKADAATDKILDASDKAIDDMHKYCSDKKASSKINRLLTYVKEMFSLLKELMKK